MTIQDLLRHTSGLVYGTFTSHAKVWVDPKERMVVVWMTQGQPGPMRGQDRDLFR
jgi:CubicO group peptidase (beta-lactamase class C family)